MRRYYSLLSMGSSPLKMVLFPYSYRLFLPAACARHIYDRAEETMTALCIKRKWDFLELLPQAIHHMANTVHNKGSWSLHLLKAVKEVNRC